MWGWEWQGKFLDIEVLIEKWGLDIEEGSTSIDVGVELDTKAHKS